MARLGSLVVAIIPLVGLGESCARVEPVALDLVKAAPLADLESPWTVALLGTPQAEAHRGSGLVPVPWRAGEDAFVWAAAKSEVAFRWDTQTPRIALVDLAPYPGLKNQSAEVELNGRAIGRIAVAQERRRYSLELPPEAQLPGKNVLRFSFSQGSARQRPHRLHLSAALYSITVGAADDAPLRDLSADHAPPILSCVPAAKANERPILFQAGGSVVRFAFLAPAQAELRFTPGAEAPEPPIGRPVTMAVKLQEENQGERELWRARIDGAVRRHQEVRLALPVAPLTLIRLSLVVEEGRAASWFAPRVLGRGPTTPRIGAPAENQTPQIDQAGLDGLRHSLQGKNVLLILLDAARARQFSAYGYSRPTTPEIDRIASEGVLFEQAMSPVGFTLLAVGSLWTSTLPDEHHNGLPYNARLPRTYPTLAEVLSKAGIHTAAFIHNAFAGTAWGLDRGFAEFDELNRRLPRGGAETFPQVVGPWLTRNRDRRFFAALHVREPHFPYLPPPPFNTLFGPDAPLSRDAKSKLDWLTDVNWQRQPARPEEIAHLVRLYDGNLRFADAQVGELRRVLEAEGLWDKTVVIVLADHGDALFEHRFIGHLNQIYQEILHIPLVVRIPGGPVGRRVSGLVDLTDLAPTITDVFGVAAPPTFRGQSLLPRLFGAPGKEALVARTAEDQPKYALLHDRFKLIHYSARGTAELYDLARDPLERDDLAARQPLRTSFYRQALFAFMMDMRRLPEAEAEIVELSAEQKESLRALGYVR